MFSLSYLNQTAFTWFLTMINTIVPASIILLGALMINRLAKQSSAGFRFFLIFLALSSFLILPTIADLIPDMPLASSFSFINRHPNINRENSFQDIAKPRILLKNNNSNETPLTLWTTLFLIWFLGVMGIGLRVSCGVLGMYRLLRATGEHEERMFNWPKDLTVRVATHPKLQIPVTYGLFFNRVFLPLNSRDWPMEQREAILCHEAAHIARRDNLTNLIAHIIASFYWFNPLVWLALNQLRINREKACDDWVLHTAIKPSHYAGILLEAIRANNHSKMQHPAALYFNSKGEERLKHILNSEVNHQLLSTKAKVLMLLVTVILLIPLSAFRLLAAGDNPPIADSSYHEILPQISLNGNAVIVNLIFDDKSTQLFTCSSTEVPIGWPEKEVRNNYSSGFGYQIHPILKKRMLHSGIDIRSKPGTPIVAAADGRVIKAKFMAGYGKTVIVEHSHFATLYAQLSEIEANVGDDVKQGQLIGYSGKSGIATGPHLHYEIRYQSTPMNPQPFLETGLSHK